VTAFWFSILVPSVLFAVSWPLIQRLIEEGDGSFVMASLGIASCGYAAVGYSLARWLFLHAQEKQSHEDTNTSTWSFLPAFAAPRKPVPIAALLVKELRLQDGTLVIAAVLVLLHLAAVAAPQYFRSWSSRYPFLDVIWMVWWMAPLLVGCASIAEERRVRTLESALCLPVGKLAQFTAKLLVVFGLGIFLGAVMPWLLEQLQPAEKLNHAGITNFGLPKLLLIAAILTAIGFYASSLSSTLLQSLGGAIGLLLLPFLVTFSFNLSFAFVDRAVEDLQSFGWPILSATCLFLSYSNFKQLRSTWRQCSRNVLILLVVLDVLFAFTSR
jgi:hypothetical protein